MVGMVVVPRIAEVSVVVVQAILSDDASPGLIVHQQVLSR